MTSFIAAGGSGRSTSVIPAVPAAWSVTTIAFIRHLALYSVLAVAPCGLPGLRECQSPRRTLGLADMRLPAGRFRHGLAYGPTADRKAARIPSAERLECM